MTRHPWLEAVYPVLRWVRRWLRSRVGVRLGSALAASAVVGVALVAAGVALVAATHTIMINNVDVAARQRADQVAEALTAAADPRGVTIPASAGDQSIVQLVDPAGRVVATSGALAGQAPLSPQRPAAGQLLRDQRRMAEAEHEAPVYVVALGVATTTGTYTVLVGQSLHGVGESTETVTALLTAGLPILTLVVGAATFWFVGRVLRPVEAMRARAATISASTLDARLPVPAARDEIAALARTMNDLLDRIQAAGQAQRRFVSDASHELRSPLATIHAGLDLLAGQRLPDPTGAGVERMRLESTRMAVLIEDLLLLARFDERGVQLRWADVDLDDLAYQEGERLNHQHPHLRVATRIQPARVRGDTRHLHRAIRNLTDNAARHATTTVTITVTVDAATARLVVADDGPGVPIADRTRVFDRFVRLDDSRARRAGGAGLGLPIARDIVQAHNGTIELTGVAAGGAACQIVLPLAGGDIP